MHEDPVMEAAVLEDRRVASTKAWRISFRSALRPGEQPLLVMREPRSIVAVSEPIDAEVTPLGDSDDSRSLQILWVPPEAGAALELEAAWVEEPSAGHRVVRAGLRSIRVIWSDRRAVIYSAAEQLDDTLDAVIRFTAAERETVNLERQMAAAWSAIDAHTPLTHTVPRRGFRRNKAAIAAMTERVTQMTGLILRLQTALEQLDPNLASTSKRLYAELVLQAGIYERVEMLEDPIEFAMEHYELSNTRMIDAKTANTEFLLEMGILLALVAEVGIILVARLA
jgi:hypothetical protein